MISDEHQGGKVVRVRVERAVFTVLVGEDEHVVERLERELLQDSPDSAVADMVHLAGERVGSGG